MKWTSKAALTAMLGVGLVGCRVGTKVDGETKISESCLNAITDVALTNSRTYRITRDIAGPLGLADASARDSAPLLTRQVQFRAPDGSMHYFAVESRNWRTAAFIVADSESAGSPVTVYVIGRNGNLISSGRITGVANLGLRNIQDIAVSNEFLREQNLWRRAGPPGVCAA